MLYTLNLRVKKSKCALQYIKNAQAKRIGSQNNKNMESFKNIEKKGVPVIDPSLGERTFALL